MGKETELIKAVNNNDQQKLQVSEDVFMLCDICCQHVEFGM